MATRQQSRELPRQQIRESQTKWDEFEDEDEDEMVTVEHCTTPLQVFCTVCFVIVFASGVIAASMFSYSSSRVIWAAKNYPEFIGEVLEDAIHYQVIDQAAAKVITVAGKGLAKCGVGKMSECKQLPDFGDMTVNVQSEVAFINSTVSVCLAMLDNFAGHPLLDRVLKMTGPVKDLEQIEKLLESLDIEPRCEEMAPVFCKMASDAMKIPTEQQLIASLVEQIPQSYTIGKLTNILYVLYLIPVMTLLSLVFYLCFCLDSGVSNCSPGGSCKGCCAACCYGFCTLLVLAVTCGGVYGLVQVAHTEISFSYTIGENQTNEVRETENLFDNRRLLTLFTVKGPDVDHLLHDLDDLSPPESRLSFFMHWGIYVLFESLVALAGSQIGLLVYMIVVCCSGIYVVKHEFDPETDQDE